MQKWIIDGAHSEIGFKVKHLMVSTVRGKFNSFEGSIELPDEDLTKAMISFNAETKSIDTGNAMRDGHLQSADFFNAESFPTLSFKSNTITKVNDEKYIVVGELTIHGITKEITLNTTLNGIITGMDETKVMGLEATGVLSRQDFGLTWNAPIEKGGVVVSDEVKIEINAEFKKEK